MNKNDKMFIYSKYEVAYFPNHYIWLNFSVHSKAFSTPWLDLSNKDAIYNPKMNLWQTEIQKVGKLTHQIPVSREV